MLLVENDDLKSIIISILEKKDLSGPNILIEIEKRNIKVTRQAVYAVLRWLIQNEVINKANKLYSINRTWLQQIYDFTAKQLDIKEKTDNTDILNISDGDKITYYFKNPYKMDAYWGHIFDILFVEHNPKIPIFVYHSHEWMIYGRQKTEEFFLNNFTKNKKLVFFGIGGKTQFDLLFKKNWQSEYIQINCGEKYNFENGHYMNVLGDFIFEVFIDEKFTNDIEKIYSESTTKEEILEKIQEISKKNYKTKLIFSRNKKKAQKIMSRVSKNFVLPKS